MHHGEYSTVSYMVWLHRGQDGHQGNAKCHLKSHSDPEPSNSRYVVSRLGANLLGWCVLIPKRVAEQLWRRVFKADMFTGGRVHTGLVLATVCGNGHAHQLWWHSKPASSKLLPTEWASVSSVTCIVKRTRVSANRCRITDKLVFELTGLLCHICKAKIIEISAASLNILHWLKSKTCLYNVHIYLALIYGTDAQFLLVSLVTIRMYHF